MRLEQFVIEGLGHLSTLLADDDAGVAAIIDPRRDVDVYLAAARERDLRITNVVETHLHNDYVSGGRELAALTGASHRIGAGAELRHEHEPVRHGESFDVGDLRFTALDTPGHTPEHVSYAVAGRVERGKPKIPHVERLAMPHRLVLVTQLGARPDPVTRPRQRGQLASAGHVVVVKMRLDDVGDAQVALPGRGQVHVDVPPGVDDRGDARIVVGEQRREVPQTVDDELLDPHRPSLHRADHQASPHIITRPPSTASTWPVMNEASSLARNATADAISSVVPNRPSGVRSMS